MGLKDIVQNNFLFLLASGFAAGASTSWIVAEKVRVDPIEMEKQHLVARLDRIENFDIPQLATNNRTILEPSMQCEIVELYKRLEIAIEKADLVEITSFYAKDYRPSLHDRNIVFQAYEELLGKTVFFHISSIIYCDDGGVTVYVKAFLTSSKGKFIKSKDSLILIDGVWKFVK